MYTANQPYTLDRLIIRNRQYAKEFLRKPFTLITALSIVFSELASSAIILIMWFLTMTGPIEELNLYIQESSGSDSIGVSTSVNLTPPIGTIILVVALLLLYIRSRNNDYRATPDTGATILKVYSTINLILQVIGSAVLLLIPVITFAVLREIQRYYNPYYAGLPDRIIGVSVFFVSLYVLFHAAINIINAVGLKNFSVSLHNSLTTAELSHKGTTLYAVTNLIRAGETAVTSISASMILYNANEKLSTITDGELSAIFEQMPFRAVGLVLLLALPVYALKDIILSLFALRYRKHISDAGENGCNLPPLVLPYDKITEPETYEETPCNETPAETENAKPQTSPQNFCFMCGNPVNPEQKFCAHCGNKLN